MDKATRTLKIRKAATRGPDVFSQINMGLPPVDKV